jgi:hypothetical protein
MTSLVCRADEGLISDPLLRSHVIAGSDDAILQISPVPDIGSREQDAPLDGSPRSYPATAPHRGISSYGNPRTNNDVRADHCSPFESSCWVEPGVPVNPETLPTLLSWDTRPNLPRKQVVLGRPVGLQGTDIRPVEAALIPHKSLPGLQQAGKDILGEVEERVLRYVLKHFGL